MDLSITVNGMKFPNPFVLGSGPPGTNARVLAKSYDAGWGGAVAKTVSLESAKVVNVVPRYGKLRSRSTGEVIGFENIELISDRPIDVWLDEFRQIKKEYPNNILIASIMEEYEKSRWQELTRMVQDTGVDGFRAQLLLSARNDRTQDGFGDGRASGSHGGSDELGDGSLEDSGLGQDDAQHHKHSRTCRGCDKRWRSWHFGNQYDPVGDRSRSRHVKTDADG